MLSPEEIQAATRQRATAIFEKFDPVVDTDYLQKSEDTEVTDVFFTEEGIAQFKEDLFKSIDDGTCSDEDLQKAQDDLLNLSRETRTIDGADVTVFVSK